MKAKILVLVKFLAALLLQIGISIMYRLHLGLGPFPGLKSDWKVIVVAGVVAGLFSGFAFARRLRVLEALQLSIVYVCCAHLGVQYLGNALQPPAMALTILVVYSVLSTLVLVGLSSFGALLRKRSGPEERSEPGA